MTALARSHARRICRPLDVEMVPAQLPTFLTPEQMRAILFCGHATHVLRRSATGADRPSCCGDARRGPHATKHFQDVPLNGYRG